MSEKHTTGAQTARNAQKEAWNKDNTKQIKFRFNLNTDADILAHLESLDNVQGYVKQLIRADIAKRRPRRNAPESFVNTKEEPQ